MRVRIDRLPSGYRELEYIEGTGTQYITLPDFTNFDAWEIDCQYTSTQAEYCVLGNQNNGSGGWELYTNSGATYRLYKSGTGGIESNVSSLLRKIITYSYTTGIAEVDGISFGTRALECQPKYLFSYSTSSYISKAKVYNLKVKYQGINILNLIPAERQSDKKSGMYDLVNRIFYLSGSSSDFVKGPYASTSGTVAVQKSILSDYTELDYIESTGEQYLDTNVILNNNMNIDFDIAWTARTNVLFGVNSGGAETLLMLNRVYLNGGSTTFTDEIISVNNKYHFEINMISSNAYIKRDNDILFSRNTGTCHADSRLLLFATIFVGSETIPQYYQKYRLYSLKIRENGRLIINLIPVVNNTTNEIGMLDKVNNVFYTNQGTGTFTAGPLKYLPNEYQRVEYITFNPTSTTNGQFIRTGITTLTHPFSIKTIYKKTNTETRDQTLVGQRQIGKYPNIYNNYYETVYANTSTNTAPDNVKTTIELRSGTGVIRDGEIIYATGNTTTRTSSYELLIGAFSEDSYENYKWCFSGNIYDIEIINEGSLYKHYIPCYRKLDNIIGMYDLVGRQFYTNAGSGTFLKGPAINNTLICKIAGGSSDIYYGYNQLAMSLTSDQNWYYEYNSGPTTARTFDPVNNSSTYTCDGTNMNFRLLSGGNYRNFNFIKDHYVYTAFDMTLNTQDTTTRTFNVSSGGPYLSNTYNVTQGTNHYEGIRKLSSSKENTYIGVSCGNSNLNVTGDTCTIKDLVIIDLTDWFGVGKEPATVADFKAQFNKSYWGFCQWPIKLTEKMINALPDYGYNQQFGPYSYASRTSGGLTITWDANTREMTANGACNSNRFDLYINVFNITNTHKYLFMIESSTMPGSSHLLVGDNADFNEAESSRYLEGGYLFLTAKRDITNKAIDLMILNGSGNQFTNYKCKNLMQIDLTDWYGAGNEPTTIAEFKLTFPYKYYLYSQKTWLNKYMINKLIN